MSNKVGSLRIDLIANIAQFDKNMNRAAKRMDRFGRNMSRTGKLISQNLTAPLLAAGAAAIKLSMDMNRAMANIGTLIPGNIARVKQLKKAIQDMAIATGVSSNDIAAGMYEVISSFGDTEESVKKLDISVRAAKAGVSSTKDSLDLLSAITKAYGNESAVAMQKAADLSFTIVRLGKTTFPELSAAIGTVAPLAAEMGVKIEEVAAAYATLTGVTGDTNKVSTQMAAILRAMMKPTDAMSRAIGDKEHGLGYATAKAMIASLGMTGALKALIGTTDGTQEAVGQLFGRAEALTAVFALGGTQADNFTKKLEEMQDVAGATDTAFREQTEGINEAGHKWDQFKETVKVLGQEFGDNLAPTLTNLLPLLERMAGAVGSILEKFAALPQEVQVALLVTGPVLQGAGAVAQITAGLARAPIPMPLKLVIGGAIAAGTAAIALFGEKVESADEKLERARRRLAIYEQVFAETYTPTVKQAAVATESVADSVEHAAESFSMAGEALDGYNDALKEYYSRATELREARRLDPDTGVFSFSQADKVPIADDDWRRELRENLDATTRLLGSWGDMMSDHLAAALVNWQSFADALRGIIETILADIARMFLNKILIHPIVNAAADWMDVPSPYAPAPQPQSFGMSSPSSVIIHDQREAGTPPIETRQSGNTVEVFVKGVVAKMMSSGEMDAAMATYGARRKPRGR